MAAGSSAGLAFGQMPGQGLTGLCRRRLAPVPANGLVALEGEGVAARQRVAGLLQALVQAPDGRARRKGREVGADGIDEAGDGGGVGIAVAADARHAAGRGIVVAQDDRDGAPGIERRLGLRDAGMAVEADGREGLGPARGPGRSRLGRLLMGRLGAARAGPPRHARWPGPRAGSPTGRRAA